MFWTWDSFRIQKSCREPHAGLLNTALFLCISCCRHLPITSNQSHASQRLRYIDSTFDYWRYINISMTLTLHGARIG